MIIYKQRNIRWGYQQREECTTWRKESKIYIFGKAMLIVNDNEY